MDEQVTVTILGSGTSVPRLDRSSCSVLARVGESLILMDLGAGTLRRILEAGESMEKVTHILVSHLHPDHTAEWVPFLFATKYGGVYESRLPFTVLAGQGFEAFYKNLGAAYGHWIELRPGLLGVEEMSTSGPDHRQYPGFTVGTLPMNHTPQSVGFRLETEGGRSVVYSGDTDQCPELVELARGADLFICEAALPDESPVAGHLTPSRAGEAAERAGAKHLVLTHIYPECDAVDIYAQARKTFSGRLTVARDLMVFAL